MVQDEVEEVEGVKEVEEEEASDEDEGSIDGSVVSVIQAPNHTRSVRAVKKPTRFLD